ncbi:MAG: L-fuculose-phosphate aldolase [Proteobacteria bacterium]|nr:L-fuculose-phosphate aldolase [Pseudomonadota bacterium]
MTRPISRNETALRRHIINTGLKMNALGINQGTSGNVSARWRDGLLITPTGIPYDDLKPADIVYLDATAKPHGRHAPSSEWRFHHDIMAARPDVAAIVHTHSIHATAVAICNKPLPAVHYMIAAAGGATIRCASYATYGTQALSNHAIKALKGRSACLLANHGVIATGADLDKALWLANEVEVLAQQYILAQQVGRPRVLPATEIATVVEKFKKYGPKKKG